MIKLQSLALVRIIVLILDQLLINIISKERKKLERGGGKPEILHIKY